MGFTAMQKKWVNMYFNKNIARAFPFFLVAFLSYSFALGQTDSANVVLDEVMISASKWEAKLNEIPNKIVKINKDAILLNNPQTTADMLAQTGQVFIQKSQLGGGSPMIRGFATNRILIVVDGVRMNNAIFRSGNLQNIISIDALSIQTAEVIFGPGSLIYGSDAIGGVMDFHTLEPALATEKKWQTKGTVLSRYASANNERTGHFDVNIRGRKWSFVSSFTYSHFHDLEMGKNGGHESYLRKEYVQRNSGQDVIIQNSNPRLQRFTGYQQRNMLQKIRWQPNKKWNFQYSFTQAQTGNTPRYDRLIQTRNGSLRFAEWEYGPMMWEMHNVQIAHLRSTPLYTNLHFTFAYQAFEESRRDRTRNKPERNIQTDRVKAYNLNADANKAMGKSELFYGAEAVFNKVYSTGEMLNIETNSSLPAVSRYPDGSSLGMAGLYVRHKFHPHPKWTINSGLRYSTNHLQASFNQSFISFPFSNAKINEGALIVNAGCVYLPAESWQLNANIASGYRMPNIDDIGKLFESAPGRVTVPNPKLASEYAWNIELGLIKKIDHVFRLEVNVFYTLLNNAIALRPFQWNGQDSILFGGIKSRVDALQNVSKATVNGIQIGMECNFLKYFSLVAHANWIDGKETDDQKDEQVPLRHAPPFYGNAEIKYKADKLSLMASVFYNGAITNKNLASSEQAKAYIYATDGNGLPYSPKWCTLNFRSQYSLAKNLQLTLSWENITDKQYRPYSSGIVAAGRQWIVSGRFLF